VLLVTFIRAVKTWVPMTKAVMVPKINNVALVIVTKVIVFGSRLTWVFFCDVTICIFDIFLSFELNSSPFLSKDTY